MSKHFPVIKFDIFDFQKFLTIQKIWSLATKVILWVFFR